MKNEALEIICWFITFVLLEHQDLLYLVNKICSIGRILRHFVALLEFEIKEFLGVNGRAVVFASM